MCVIYRLNFYCGTGRGLHILGVFFTVQMMLSKFFYVGNFGVYALH